MDIHKNGTWTFIKMELSRDEMRAELCKIFIAFYYRAYQPFLNPRLYSGLCVVAGTMKDSG